MTSKLITIAALLAAPASALAAQGLNTQHHELSLELGSFGANDPQWNMFSSNDQIGTRGVRAGYALGNTLSVVGSWHTGAWGSTLEWYSDSSTDYDTAQVALAFRGHQLAVGPKAQVDIVEWLRPYATVQAMGMTGRMLMDDDLVDDDNTNELSNRGWTGGGVVALGFDLVPIRPTQEWGVGSHLEMGYGYLLPMKLTDKVATGDGADIGDLRFNGFYLRWGVGIRF